MVSAKLNLQFLTSTRYTTCIHHNTPCLVFCISNTTKARWWHCKAQWYYKSADGDNCGLDLINRWFGSCHYVCLLFTLFVFFHFVCYFSTMFEFHTVSITFLRPVTVDGWNQTGGGFCPQLRVRCSLELDSRGSRRCSDPWSLEIVRHTIVGWCNSGKYDSRVAQHLNVQLWAICLRDAGTHDSSK